METKVPTYDEGRIVIDEVDKALSSENSQPQEQVHNV